MVCANGVGVQIVCCAIGVAVLVRAAHGLCTQVSTQVCLHTVLLHRCVWARGSVHGMRVQLCVQLCVHRDGAVCAEVSGCAVGAQLGVKLWVLH